MHVTLTAEADADQVRDAVAGLLHDGYDIEHSTIQTEGPEAECGNQDELHP